MNTYFALVHKDAGSAYGISFPDLPGCFSAADEDAEVVLDIYFFFIVEGVGRRVVLH